jgi:hypothetical protein
MFFIVQLVGLRRILSLSRTETEHQTSVENTDRLFDELREAGDPSQLALWVGFPPQSLGISLTVSGG